MKSRVVMILHDAIWVDAPEEEAELARILMEDTMKIAIEFPLVPSEVDFKDQYAAHLQRTLDISSGGPATGGLLPAATVSLDMERHKQ